MWYLQTFFLRSGIHSRRTLWMAVIGFFPVGCSILLWMARGLLEREGSTLYGLFPDFSQILFLNVLLPLMAIFVGSAVIADEVEEQTLPYLITRPVPRTSIVLAKLLASFVTLAVILAVSLFLTYTVMVLDEGSGGWGANTIALVRCEGVLILGLLAYLPLFALMGGLIKRPVLTGLIFAWGWERMVEFMPGNIKLLTVVHYLHVLFPSAAGTQGGSPQNILFGSITPATEISDFTAVMILLGISAVFSFLTAMLLKVREYRLEPGT